MSANFYVKSLGGSSVIPTTNGVYYTDPMSAGYSDGKVYVEFFSDEAGDVPAVATAGTIAVEASPMGNVYIPAGTGTPISAVAVSAGTYSPASFSGSAVRGRVTLAGITGAAYAKITFWRD